MTTAAHTGNDVTPTPTRRAERREREFVAAKARARRDVQMPVQPASAARLARRSTAVVYIGG